MRSAVMLNYLNQATQMEFECGEITELYLDISNGRKLSELG
jgi:hypothetical protein